MEYRIAKRHCLGHTPWEHISKFDFFDKKKFEYSKRDLNSVDIALGQNSRNQCFCKKKNSIEH